MLAFVGAADRHPARICGPLDHHGHCSGFVAIIVVPDWWGWAALISVTGAILGAIYPGIKAARQDTIEALAYE